MVASDVATTCTSRIAMNMPMHIMAKPTQTVAVTEPVVLFSVAEIIAGPVEEARSITARPFRHKPQADGQCRSGWEYCAVRFWVKPTAVRRYPLKFGRFDRNVGGSQRWRNASVPHICHARAG